jgi:phosphoribosylformylglycinamidine cyclo-ligase
VSSGGRTYEAAGVSLAAAEEVVGRLRAAVDSTRTPAVEGSFGGFAGLYALDERRLLAASTDSVGSKLVLSRRAGRLRDAGRDLAAHCIDDVLTTGAEPLFLLDYVAAHELDLDQIAELVEGAAEVCREAGCALIGGETAELPGIYREHELDFAGTCVGIVERERLIDGSRCEPGDVVLGLASSGLHTNGFSLVRRLVGEGGFDADLLLAPHRLYLEDVRALRDRADVKALAHVTGGGILGNLTRVLPPGIGVEIEWDAWARPPVYAWLDEQGVEEEEQRRVFNLGIGMCAVVPEQDARAATVIGRLT